MDFNTTIIRFGFDPSNFVNKPLGFIKTNKGFIYEVGKLPKQRIINVAYRYRNFKRFRARTVLIVTYKKGVSSEEKTPC